MDRDSTERLLLGVILTAWAARPSRQEFAPPSKWASLAAMRLMPLMLSIIGVSDRSWVRVNDTTYRSSALV